MRLVREGYETAFEEIVRRYGRPLGRYAASIVGGRSEDVLQDAFAKALPALLRDEAEIDLRPWLFRIVRNTALNDLRDSPPSPELLAEALAGGRNPVDELEQREELADLMRRLQALPEPQRAAIVMRELEGLGHEEIAAALGLTGGGARQAIYRARQALRDGAGMLLPLPLLRLLADHGGEAAGTGGAIAAAGASAGGAGAGGAIKVGVLAALLAGSVGAGVAVHDHRKDNPAGSHGATAVTSAAPGRGPTASTRLADAVLTSGPRRPGQRRHGAGSGQGSGGASGTTGRGTAVQVGERLQGSGGGPGSSSGPGRRHGERHGGQSSRDDFDGDESSGRSGRGGSDSGHSGGSDHVEGNESHSGHGDGGPGDDLLSSESGSSGRGGSGGGDESSSGSGGNSGPGGGGSSSGESPDSVASPPPAEASSEEKGGSGDSGGSGSGGDSSYDGSRDGGQEYESP
ncbi:MAG TPA: sigma-70 family RNA polymerase sigma factor [Solirubrobacterales bacterium]|nr:sigma-70 family RNA polymerase sigma factor [Solirubrobacterales bacterium]